MSSKGKARRRAGKPSPLRGTAASTAPNIASSSLPFARALPDSDDEAAAELEAAMAAAAQKSSLMKSIFVTLSSVSADSSPAAVEAASAVFAAHPDWIDGDIAGRGVKQTALHTSCKHGHSAVVKYLLQTKANPNAEVKKEVCVCVR